MSAEQVPISRVVANIISVLAVVLVLSLLGLIGLGIVDGDAGVRSTLTHIAETVIGVFVGLAAGRLASAEAAAPAAASQPSPNGDG